MLWLLYLLQRTRIDAWFFPRCHLEHLAFCNKRTGKSIPVPALLRVKVSDVHTSTDDFFIVSSAYHWLWVKKRVMFGGQFFKRLLIFPLSCRIEGREDTPDFQRWIEIAFLHVVNGGQNEFDGALRHFLRCDWNKYRVR